MSSENEQPDLGVSRRKFLQASAAAGAVSAFGIAAMAEEGTAPAFIRKIEPSDTVNVGYIGVGVRGKQHMRYSGFPHPEDKDVDKGATTNLPRPLNIRAMAMSDCYLGNQNWAKGAVPDIKVYPDYRELLADKNVDAIFIGTSDHNHAPVGIDACAAGKHIYSEKSFANTFEDVVAYRDAIKKAGIVFQLGHQTRSGTLMERGKKALGGIDADGKVGKVTLIETYTNRNNPNGAWIYKIPSDISPQTVDWARFTGKGPQRAFDADRFCRFRKYWDYGTGHSGDLLSHEMDAIQQITGLGIPTTATASGGNFFYFDGRETPDVYQVCFNYEPEKLLVTYNGTLANSRSRERTIFGHDGMMDMTNGIKIVADKYSDRYAEMIEGGNWVVPIEDEGDTAKREKVKSKTSDTMEWTIDKGIYIEIIGDKEVNVTGLHVLNFVECIRAGNLKTNCNVEHAFQEGVIVHMADQAFKRGRRVRWDAQRELIVNDNA